MGVQLRSVGTRGRWAVGAVLCRRCVGVACCVKMRRIGGELLFDGGCDARSEAKAGS